MLRVPLEGALGMKIFVKTLTFGTITLDVKASDTINNAKKQLCQKLDSDFTGFNVELALDVERVAVWLFEGKPLEDDRTLWDYDIQGGATIRSTFGLAGGGQITIPY